MSDLITSLLNLARHRGLADYERSDRDHDPAFGWRPVHHLVELDMQGIPVGISRTVSQRVRTRDPKTKKVKVEDAAGKEFFVPIRYSLGSSNETPQDFLAGKAKSFFPQPAKKPVSWEMPDHAAHCWSLVLRANEKLDSRHLQAVVNFLRTEPTLEWLKHFCEQRKYKPAPAKGDTVSFRVAGKLIFQIPGVAEWWSNFHRGERKAEIEKLPDGTDLYQCGIGKVAAGTPTVFGNTPLTSFSRPQFTSFGLGEGTSRLRIDTAERVSAALNALDNKGAVSKVTFGENHFLFWAAKEASGEAIDCSFIRLLELPDGLQVRKLLRGVFGSRAQPTEGEFHAVVLRCPKGRFNVRSWHTDSLATVGHEIERYFQTARGLANSEIVPPMRRLAESLRPPLKSNAKPDDVKKLRSELSNAFAALLNSALWGWPLPPALLQAALLRQTAEMACFEQAGTDFSRLRARCTVIHLYLEYRDKNSNKTTTMNEPPNTTDGRNHPACRLGRLLGMLSRIHNRAHEGKSGSDPASRYYGSASKTPYLVFPRLLQLTRYHLEKIGQKSRRDCDLLKKGVPERGLAGLDELAGWFHEHGAQFGRMLNLEEQGRFAIGFYRECMNDRDWNAVLSRTARPTVFATAQAATEDKSNDNNQDDNQDKDNE